MKTMRIPLLCALGIAVLGIVFGSFFDLQISKAIADPNSGFGLAVSAIGPTIGFGAVALMGGGFIAFGLKKEYHIVLRILFFVLAACCFGVSIFYPQGEYFGRNGFYHPELNWLAYIIVIIAESGAMVGGYFLFRKVENTKMWIVFCVVIALLLIGLLAVIPTIKDNMHRPRYRFIRDSEAVVFHNWWQPYKEYGDMMRELEASGASEELIKTVKENCKSYPSGHSAEASILLVAATFFPMADKKFQKHQLPIFLGACGCVALVMFARILAAAHYLSDVCWGTTIILVLTIIANEVLMRIKALQLKEEEKE